MNNISFGQAYRIWCQDNTQKEYLKIALPKGKVLEKNNDNYNKLLYVPESQWKEINDIAASLARVNNINWAERQQYIDDKMQIMLSNAEKTAIDVRA